MKNIGNFYLKIFSCLEVKFSIYLNRRVFIMYLDEKAVYPIERGVNMQMCRLI